MLRAVYANTASMKDFFSAVCLRRSQDLENLHCMCENKFYLDCIHVMETLNNYDFVRRSLNKPKQRNYLTFKKPIEKSNDNNNYIPLTFEMIYWRKNKGLNLF